MVRRRSPRGGQRGLTLIGLLFWAVILGLLLLVAMKVFPTISEYYTIQRVVDKVAAEGAASKVPAIRAAFDKAREVEYGIVSLEGKDLDITKENDKVVISFAYDKQIELMEPVYILIKYHGRSK